MQQEQKTKFSKRDGERLEFIPKNKKFDKGSSILPLLLHLEFTTVHNVKRSKNKKSTKC
jgi:hypothetical protein